MKEHNFEIGDFVMCIDDSPHSPGERLLQNGTIYIVRSLRGKTNIRLEGVELSLSLLEHTEKGWNPARFLLLRDILPDLDEYNIRRIL